MLQKPISFPTNVNDSPPSFDLKGWLDGVGLAQYASALEAQDITLETLCKLTPDDLKECGVQSIGHRKTIMSAIEDLKAQWPSGMPEAAPSAPAAPAASKIPTALQHIPAPAFLAEPTPPPAVPRESVPIPDGAALSKGGAGVPTAVPKQEGSQAGRLTPRARPSSEAAPVVAHAPIAPHEPKQEKPPLIKRFLAAYRKANGSSLLLSIGIHAVILLIGTYLVVSQIVEDRKISFGGGEPGSKSEVQHKVKRKTTTAPAPNKRITTTSSVAKVALPEMPNVQMNMGPTIAGAMSSGGFGSVGAISSSGSGGGGGGKGGFSKITFFGLRGGNQGTLLKGIFYDLKQTQDGKPSGIETKKTDDKGADWVAFQENAFRVVRDFVSHGWDTAILAKYFRSDTPLYTSRVYVPIDNSTEAPKAFGVEDKVKPNLWIVHYKGRFRARKDGEFRFVGCGDNILVVRLNKQNIFDGSGSTGGCIDPKLKVSPPESLGPVCAGVWNAKEKNAWNLTPGKWFRTNLGSLYDIEVIIGDTGGLFSAFLLFEERGAKYGNRKNGFGVAYPLFQLDNSPMPKNKTPKHLEDLNPDVVVIPGIFEGTASGL